MHRTVRTNLRVVFRRSDVQLNICTVCRLIIFYTVTLFEGYLCLQCTNEEDKIKISYMENLLNCSLPNVNGWL